MRLRLLTAFSACAWRARFDCERLRIFSAPDEGPMGLLVPTLVASSSWRSSFASRMAASSASRRRRSSAKLRQHGSAPCFW